MEGEKRTWAVRSVDPSLAAEKCSVGEVKAEDAEATGPVTGKPVEGLNMRFVHRLWALTKLTFKKVCGRPVLLLVIMFFCMGIDGMMQILIFNYFGTSQIIADVLAKKTGKAFIASLAHIGVNVVVALVQSICAFCGAVLALYMQKAVVCRVHNNYFANKVMYNVNKVEKRIDSIDQRVVSDLLSLRDAVSWLLGSPFTYQQFRLGMFPLTIRFIIMIGYAFSLSWSLTVFFLLCLFVSFLCQIFSSYITAKATNMRQQAEGVLRLHYGRVRLFVESITFFNGQEKELARAQILLDETAKARMHYVLRAALTTLPTVTMYYWLQNGDYVMGSIIQLYLPFARFSIANTYTILTFLVLTGKAAEQLVMSMGGLGMLAGLTHRVMEMVETTDDCALHAKDTFAGFKENPDQVAFEQVTIVPPRTSRVLVAGMDCSLPLHSPPTAIVGPSGCGKSAVLRALAGLWPVSAGQVTRPLEEGPTSIFFVPQSNYVTEGTLRQQLIYPLDEKECSDEELMTIMDDVGMEYIVDRWGFDQELPWDEVLSGGEQQRLGWARMFLHSPRFGVMDEATSALDTVLEKKVMKAAFRRGITILSVATRPSAVALHSRVLRLDGDCSCLMPTPEAVHDNADPEDPSTPHPSLFFD